MNERDWHNAWVKPPEGGPDVEIERLQKVIADQALTIAALKDTVARLESQISGARGRRG